MDRKQIDPAGWSGQKGGFIAPIRSSHQCRAVTSTGGAGIWRGHLSQPGIAVPNKVTVDNSGNRCLYATRVSVSAKLEDRPGLKLGNRLNFLSLEVPATK